jgi:hypothetical protein
MGILYHAVLENVEKYNLHRTDVRISKWFCSYFRKVPYKWHNHWLQWVLRAKQVVPAVVVVRAVAPVV